MKYKDFYTELGKLLYAIAKADGSVGKKEFNALKSAVKQEVLPLESSKDQFGTDNGYNTEMEFEFLEENFADPEAAFESFLDFVETHQSAITPEMRNLIAKISEHIAKSELGVHKKEQRYLDRLNEKMNSLV